MHPLYRLSLPRFLPAHLPHLQGAGIKSALALLLAADCSPLPYPTRTAYTIGGMLRLANSLQDVSRQLCPRGRAYAPLAPACCCRHRCCAPWQSPASLLLVSLTAGRLCSAACHCCSMERQWQCCAMHSSGACRWSGLSGRGKCLMAPCIEGNRCRPAGCCELAAAMLLCGARPLQAAAVDVPAHAACWMCVQRRARLTWCSN